VAASLDVIFTIVSRNYAAQAATLMQSLAKAEPSVRRVVIATDGPIPQLEAYAEVMRAETLDAPFAAMTVYYDALELNTAVKPFVFRKLLAEAQSVTYLDPDIYVFQPLDVVRQALQHAELALTPHVTRPLAGEALPNDRAILQSGVWNLGFAAMRSTPATLALVDWWAGKCRFDCRVDFEAGLFTDQRWMDLAPGLVERFAPLRDPGLNLAYWNLEGRSLARGPAGWSVDARPLSFFHFSGFDPARPEVLSKHQDRIAVQAGSPLAELLGDYAQALLANGHAQASAVDYGHARFPSGQPVTREMRRRALAAARAGEDFSAGLTALTEGRLAAEGVRRAAHPAFQAPQGDILAWLRGADAGGRPHALIALMAARADLRDRFGQDPQGLIAWCLGVEAPAGRFAPELLPQSALSDPDLPLRAARFAAPEASHLQHRLSAAFGLAARGRWPASLTAPLRAPLLAQVPGVPAPFPRLFQEIWQSRTDLQRQFPLRTLFQRFRYLRWLVGGGLAAYDAPLELLPGHPLLALARRSVGAAPAPVPHRASAGELWVIEDPEEALEAAADRLVYVAATGAFIGPAGPAEPPGHVAVVRVLTQSEFLPADTMALHTRGVRWDRIESP
ncbi:hypothetical protein, partial [Phenylobacterium sp.]|uniref:hypothetical protein n=1 Tax=Phenylobacterium sp. TaxID=1871053 RepID=UPI002DEB7F75|nr:hypothetical protein [Phenylobacterium sp.]